MSALNGLVEAKLQWDRPTGVSLLATGHMENHQGGNLDLGVFLSVSRRKALTCLWKSLALDPT